MRFTILLLASVFFFSVSAQAQNDKSAGKDTAEISILNVYTDSFPDVSVIFKAATRKGRPILNIAKEKITLNQNSKPAEIVSLDPVSKKQPVNVGIVLDHSASMVFGNEFAKDDGRRPALTSKHTPMDDARWVISSFVRGLNPAKDKMSVVAFCNKVDKKLPLTGDTIHVNSFLDSFYSHSSSALYDGIIEGINQVKKGNGLHILVVLTDGTDNASKAHVKDVINASLKAGVPVYVIGLGSANKDSMVWITTSTKGGLYLPKTAADFKNIAATISKKLDLYYDLVFKSTDLSSTDSTAALSLSFASDSFNVFPKDTMLHVPAKAMTEMKAKEKSKQNMLYIAIALLLVIVTSIIVFVMRQRKKNEKSQNPVIYSIHPNPSTGIINMNYANAYSSNAMEVTDASGKVVKSTSFSRSESQFNFSDLPDGEYSVRFQCRNMYSNKMQFTIKK